MTDHKPKDDLPAESPGSSPETDEPTPPEAQAEPAAPRSIALLIAIVISLGALVATGVLGVVGFKESQRIKTVLDAQSEQLDRMSGKFDGLDPKADIQALRRDIAKQIDALKTQQSAEANRLQTLDDAIRAIHSQTTRSQRGWVIAEAKYLMRTANYRLHLARDVEGAIAALEAADQRLYELSDPSLLPVRESLADEIQALHKVKQPDLVGMALRLDRIITGLKPLPPASPVSETKEASSNTTSEDEAKTLEGLAEAVWKGLSEQITVRRHGTVVSGLPDAEAEMYLHQMLRLKLEAARLALLRADNAEFHRQLDSAVGWMDEHFDQADAGDLRATLTTLNQVDLRPPLPSISGSLTLLEELTGPGKSTGGSAS